MSAEDDDKHIESNDETSTDSSEENEENEDKVKSIDEWMNSMKEWVKKREKNNGVNIINTKFVCFKAKVADINKDFYYYHTDYLPSFVAACYTHEKVWSVWTYPNNDLNFPTYMRANQFYQFVACIVDNINRREAWLSKHDTEDFLYADNYTSYFEAPDINLVHEGSQRDLLNMTRLLCSQADKEFMVPVQSDPVVVHVEAPTKTKKLAMAIKRKLVQCRERHEEEASEDEVSVTKSHIKTKKMAMCRRR